MELFSARKTACYFLLLFIEFVLNVVFTVTKSLISASYILLRKILDVNMTESSKKRKKNNHGNSNQTIANRNIIDANWHKLLSSGILMESKTETVSQGADKQQFTGVFRRSRKKRHVSTNDSAPPKNDLSTPNGVHHDTTGVIKPQNDPTSARNRYNNEQNKNNLKIPSQPTYPQTNNSRRNNKKDLTQPNIRNGLKTLHLDNNSSLSKVSMLSGAETIKAQESNTQAQTSQNALNNNNNKKNKLTKFLAMDCEMVGIGFNGEDHMIARVSLVNKFGDCIYDKFVKPREAVVDYRTSVSGVRKEDLLNGEDFDTVQKEVAELIRGRILVGHSINHDLSVLFLSHPKRMIRDTSKYKPFRKITKGNTPSLKRLAKEILGIEIQHAEHSSVEDARAVMQLYCTVAKKWEETLSQKRGYNRKLLDEL